MKAEVWSIENCPYCERAKKLLKHKGIEYEEKSGFHPDHPTVPYILIDGRVIGGFHELTGYIRTSSKLRDI